MRLVQYTHMTSFQVQRGGWTDFKWLSLSTLPHLNSHRLSTRADYQVCPQIYKTTHFNICVFVQHVKQVCTA